MKRYGVYTKVSKKIFDNKDMLNECKEKFYKYAKNNNFTIESFYIDIESRNNKGKEKFNILINDIKQGKINTIITDDFIKMMRNASLNNLLTELINNFKFDLITTDNIINTELHGYDLLIGSLAIYKKASIEHNEKARKGLRENAQNGFFNGSIPPYGYNCINGKLHLKKDNTPEIVKRIFKEYINGSGVDKIAKTLTLECVPTPATISGKSNKSEKWHGSSIKIILQNQAYIGHLIQLKETTIENSNYREKTDIEEQIIIKNNHEAIISEEDFNKVQKRLTSSSKKVGKMKDRPLKGLLICPDCKKGMLYATNRKGYICSTYKKYGKDLCTSHVINEKDILSIVNIEINKYINNKNTSKYKQFSIIDKIKYLEDNINLKDVLEPAVKKEEIKKNINYIEIHEDNKVKIVWNGR